MFNWYMLDIFVYLFSCIPLKKILCWIWEVLHVQITLFGNTVVILHLCVYVYLSRYYSSITANADGVNPLMGYLQQLLVFM